MAKEKTPVRLTLAPNQVRGFKFENYKNVSARDLATLGISMDSAIFPDVAQTFRASNYGMDASVAMQTVPTITNPVQFFQHWLPRAIEIATAARKIDDIVGRTIAGTFEDEEIVQTIMERTGSARPYTDTANIPLSSWNPGYVTRNVIRFEEGLEVGYLEAMRASRMRFDSHDEKVKAATLSLAIAHNEVGFFGYAGGENKTYGFLNDPNLPAYQTVAATTAGDTEWAKKTFNEITSDIIEAVSALQNQLAGLFDPTRDSFTMVISLVTNQWLYTMNELGTKSVSTWLKETYPNLRLETAVELNGANGGENIFYLFADEVNGYKTIDQYVQEVFRLIGVEKKAKVIVEDYASATAGVIVNQPVGVVRRSGI
jgi:hypothetical protein